MRPARLHTSTLGRCCLTAATLALLCLGGSGQALAQPVDAPAEAAADVLADTPTDRPPHHGGPPPHHRGGPPGGRPGMPLDRALKQLELPTDVRADVDNMVDEAKQKRRELHQSLKAAHEAMRMKLEAVEPDETEILAQADEIGRLRTELDKTRLRTLLRINRRLSPEQREALTDLLQKPRHGRGKHKRPEQ